MKELIRIIQVLINRIINLFKTKKDDTSLFFFNCYTPSKFVAKNFYFEIYRKLLSQEYYNKNYKPLKHVYSLIGKNNKEWDYDTIVELVLEHITIDKEVARHLGLFEIVTAEAFRSKTKFGKYLLEFIKPIYSDYILYRKEYCSKNQYHLFFIPINQDDTWNFIEKRFNLTKYNSENYFDFPELTLNEIKRN